MSGPVQCPGCTRRNTMKVCDVVYSEAAQEGEIVSWQCVYCGAVCEPNGPKTWAVVRYQRIMVRPGELEAMRDARAAKR